MRITKGDGEGDGRGPLTGNLRLHRWKTCITCLVSFLVSLTGGVILVFWEMDYHPKNCQLWMVPFGLILFGTPLIIWFSAFVSDIFCPNKEEDGLPVFSRDGRTGTSSSSSAHLVSNSMEDAH